MTQNFSMELAIADTGALVTVSTAINMRDDYNTMLGFTEEHFLKADVMYVTVYNDTGRFRLLKGSEATATLGHEVVAGTTLRISGKQNIRNFSIAKVTSDIALFVTLSTFGA